MEENANEIKPVVGHCLVNGASYSLPINENTIIERCASDKKYINQRSVICEKEDNAAKIVVRLSAFFNTDERTQLFSIADPKDKEKKILIIRVNGDFAVVLFPDFECVVATNASKTKYNSFVFNDKLKYETFRHGDHCTITLTKAKRFYGTIKEYFEQNSCYFDIVLGELMMEMI